MSQGIALSILVALTMSASAWAADIKTKYYITGDYASATTKITAADAEQNKLLNDWLWKGLSATFLKGSFVSGIQQTQVREEVSEYSWSDYKTHKRKFGAFISLNLPSRVSMLVMVEEELRRCKQSAVSAASGGGDFDEGASTPPAAASCQLSTKTTITGPLAIYGTYANSSGLNMDRLLRDKQTITFEAERSYDLKDVTITSKFAVNSMLFEQSLFKFLEVFNVAGVERNPQLLTRQRLLLGIARIARQTNERMLEL